MEQNPNFLSFCYCVLTHSLCLILNLWACHSLATRYSFYFFKIFARKYKCLICYVACGRSSLLLLFTWVIPAICRHHLKYFAPSLLLSFLPSFLLSLSLFLFSLSLISFPFLSFIHSLFSYSKKLFSVPLAHAIHMLYTCYTQIPLYTSPLKLILNAFLKTVLLM